MGEGGIGVLAALILGVFLVMAAVVVASPDHADEAWDLTMTIIKWLGICLVVLAIIIAIVIILIVWAG